MAVARRKHTSSYHARRAFTRHRPAKYGSRLHRKRISDALKEHHSGRRAGVRKRDKITPRKWMQKLHLKKGALHRALHIPAGKKIPKSALARAARSRNPHMRRMATLAETFARVRRKRSRRR